MRQLGLKEGRRRRNRLLTAWIVAVVGGTLVGTSATPGGFVLGMSNREFLAVFAVIAAAILVPLFLVRRRNAEVYQWYLRGRCLTCGYDLRANDDRCPECGRPSGLLRL